MLFILLLSWLSCLSTTLSISNSTTTKNFILNAFFTLSKNPRQENNSGQILHPVVLLPGYMGSRLEVAFNRESVAWPVCPLSGTKTLWFSVPNFGPFAADCWLDNVRLHYDNNTRRSFSDPGVTVTPYMSGSASGLEYIAPLPQHMSSTLYFANMIKALEDLGYTKDLNIRGLSYDWRKALYENEDFISGLKTVIESTYEENGRFPVVIVCHSMGCTFSYAFLLNQPTAWKDKYVSGWANIGAPFGGNFKYMYHYMGDDDYPADLFKIIRPAERTFSSTMTLFPRQAVFGDDVFVQSSTRTYTSRPEDIRDYLYALNYPEAYEQYLDSKVMYSDDSFASPGNFPILCLTGVGQKTLESAVVEGELRRGQPYQALYGDGDEYVNTKSSRRCLKFGDDNRLFFYHELVSDHMNLIKGSQGISVAMDFVNFINKGSIRTLKEFGTK